MERSDPRNLEIARRLARAIDDYNERADHGSKFKIDSNVSRILAHDPDYVARSPKAKGTRATQQPSVLTLMDAASRLGITLAQLLGENPPDTVTAIDRAKLEEIAAELVIRAEWLRERFGEPARRPDTAGSPRPEADRTDEPPEYPIMNK